MEFVDGASLKERIRRRKTLEVEATLPLLRQLCDGIQAVHEAGVVHRDVKPSNVLVTREGDVKVCDFGLAFTEGVGLTRITQTGASMGTPEYMAPEQIEGRRVDSRADIYSLGALMYEVFTGELPFVGENSMAIIMQHLNRAPLPPSTRNPALPVWLERIILRAMEKEPSRRFQSMDEIRRELASSRSGRRTERHPATGDLITYNENAGATRVTIHSQNERAEWTESTALRFGERFYKLVRSTVAGASTHPFVYTFESWPDAEVLRRVLEYEESAVVEPKARWEGLKKLFGKE